MSRKNVGHRRAITYCRLCTALCGLSLEIVDNEVVKVVGDREHPLTGGFTCRKGRSIGALHADSSRFTTAQRRSRSGELEPVSTDTAIAEVGKVLREILEQHGPDAIGLYAGTYSHLAGLTRPVLMAFWSALGSHKYFSTITLDQAPKRVTPRRMGRWLGGPQRFDDSDVWMFVGYNPLVSMMGRWLWGFPPQNGVRQLRDAKRRGMKLIVLDPRRTETAAHADLHLQLRPGSDPIVLAGLLNVILDERLEDRDFCADYVDGLDALRKAVQAATPEFVAARAGLPAAAVIAAAHCFASARKGMVATGTGANMGRWGNLTEHLAVALNVVCGRYARAGEPYYHTPVLAAGPVAPRAAVAAPDRSWEYDSYRSRVRGGTSLIDGEVPSAVLADEILEPGDDRLRALLVLGGNPAAAIPEQGRIVDALAQLELMVSIEPFPTETARLSHYVLPPALCLETAEHTGLKEGWLNVPFAQYAPAVLEPPPGVREDWQYVFALARELRLELQIFGRSFRPEDPLPTAEELLDAAAAQGLIPLEDVKRQPHGRLYELEPPQVEPAADEGGRLALLPDDVAAELRAALADAGDSLRPYHLIVRRGKGTYNSTGRRISASQPKPYNPCHLHPEELAALGVADGGLVRLASEHGSIVAIAEADQTLRKGVVSISHVFGDLPGNDTDPHSFGSNPGRLLSASAHLQPFSGQPWMTAVPVTVEPLEQPRLPAAVTNTEDAA